MLALTRAVPASITGCELTHIAREPIDFQRATQQHHEYETTLSASGCTIVRLPPSPALPDSAFVEDLAVVLREVAVIARPGAASRRAEVPAMTEALRGYRPLAFIEAPGTLDGGDVLCIGAHIVVGRSGRTNDDAIRQLRAIAAPFGYAVQAVDFTGCLHLKTAVTTAAGGTVLLNPAWVDPGIFAAYECIAVHEGEPFAANALLVGGTCLCAAQYPRTADAVEQCGVAVRRVACDELAKAEAGLTCCSVLVDIM